MMKPKINIILLCKVKNEIITELRHHLEDIFKMAVEISTYKLDLTYAYDEKRRQYLSEKILTKFETSKIKIYEKCLVIVDVDIYSVGLNFVFGIANPYTNTSIISLKRLKQEFYGLPNDEFLFIKRIKKEATHELGHLFYLGHCQDKKCVMHFSNSLKDTDEKSALFCDKCRKKLLSNFKL